MVIGAVCTHGPDQFYLFNVLFRFGSRNPAEVLDAGTRRFIIDYGLFETFQQIFDLGSRFFVKTPLCVSRIVWGVSTSSM